MGNEVRYVKNITDVAHMRNDDHDSLTAPDKVEQEAETEGRTPGEIADFYTDAWLEDEALLNILAGDVMPKATDHIGEMISLTERLLDNGLAYNVDGTIYSDASAFPRAAARVAEDYAASDALRERNRRHRRRLRDTLAGHEVASASPLRR